MAVPDKDIWDDPLPGFFFPDNGVKIDKDGMAVPD